ncbi:neuronal acetylcholine receptor subunit alpha-7 [Caerostris darwini]|uniref:Neuronal acetylcholine receptor subunit alpha-7 n=1 Tax=Caerostris darwini TaxID=1538125 RepID=A0AAV4RTL1_9ARAC|nr:neuronal acetylcholine receptor subunit alpha-7 [Caerostris darwini]
MTKSFSHACHCIYRSSTPDKALFPASNAQVIVLPCGTVTWLPFVTIRSRCPMRKRPMKGHVECSIKIGSWVYSGRFVSINLKRKEVDLTEFEDTNPDWTLANMKLINESRFHLLDKVYEEYPSFTFNVTLKPRW